MGALKDIANRVKKRKDMEKALGFSSEGKKARNYVGVRDKQKKSLVRKKLLNTTKDY